jgi:hypothetical protein
MKSKQQGLPLLTGVSGPRLVSAGCFAGARLFAAGSGARSAFFAGACDVEPGCTFLLNENPSSSSCACHSAVEEPRETLEIRAIYPDNMS